MEKTTGRRFRPAVEHLEAREVPANFTVATVPELIAAIDAANLTREADTIELVPGTTFTLTAVNNVAHGSTGLPVVAAGEDLTILGNNDIIERSTVAGTPAFRLFDVAAGASLTLENLTLQGGRVQDSPPNAKGGAIWNQGTATLHGVTVQNNAVQGTYGPGSGYFIPGGDAAGGGVFSSGVLTLDGCTILSNTTAGGRGLNSFFFSGGAPGMGTYIPASPGGNALGGGVCISVGTAVVTNTTIRDNTATGGAGGQEGSKKSLDAPDGEGRGGGIFIAAGAVVSIDPFSLSNTKKNHASTADNNIAGL